MKPIKSITIFKIVAGLLAGLALLLAGWLTGPAYADSKEFLVPCRGLNSDLHLASGIRQANSNPGLDKLILTEGCTYVIFKVYNDTNPQTGLPTITDDLIIEGNGAIIERSTAPNTLAFRLLESQADLTLRNVTLRNGSVGSSSPGGGAIYTSKPLTLTNVTLSRHRSSGSTGAVNALSSLKLDQVTIKDNEINPFRETRGAGISVGGNLVATGITVTHNLINRSGGCECSGGGIYVAGDAVVSEATFAENEIRSTNIGGGGLYVTGKLTLSGSRFFSNIAGFSGGGGGVRVEGDLIVTNSQFFSNTAGSRGGGGVRVEGNLTMTNSDFFYNKGVVGAGVYANGKTTISHSRFYTNTTTSDRGSGGGLLSGGVSSVAESEFVGNIAFDGGGINIGGGGNSLITGSLFEGNRGGGVLSLQPVRLENNRFINNRAPWGGGAHIDSGVALNNVFEGNQALAEEDSGVVNFGGGLFVLRDATIRNNLFVRNQADEGGGALAIAQFPGGGSSLIVNNLLVGNDAPTGAAINIGFEFPQLPDHNGGLSEIHHNTIARDSRSDGSAVQIVIGTANLRNNIITRHGIGLGAGNRAVVTSDHNLFFDNLLNYAGVAAGPHDLTADPRFVAPAQGNFHLSANSPARDAGGNAGIALDLDGAARPQGSGFDIGAYEFGGTPAPGPGPGPGGFSVFLPLVVK